MRREGFSRLATELADVGESADPVADLAMLGRAYYDNAIDDPNLYRVTFMEQALDPADAAIGSETFDSLVAGVQRCIASGRFDAADARRLATEFWAIGHGVITLQLAGLLPPEVALRCLDGAVLKLFRAYGDDSDAARRSLGRARRTAGVGLDSAA